MKVLWITNLAIGELSQRIYGKKSNGLWMDALLKEFVDRNEHDLVVATTGNNKENIHFTEGRVSYYLLSGGLPNNYKGKKKENIKNWKKIIDDEKPDVIMLWGNEFSHGLSALLAAEGQIPAVVYMQGVVDSIVRYYYAGIDYNEIKKYTTLRNIIKRDGIIAQKKKFEKSAVVEKEIFDIAGNIISENIWCRTHIEAISPGVRTHFCALSINEIFKNYSWSLENIERHTIMCNASGYPLKGLHILIKALGILKNKYPDVKLYVPGNKMVADSDWKSQLFKDGYSKYIEDLINKCDVVENIEFLGRLSQDKLAEQISKVNAFVVPSSIENHSSSLKEAMLVGTPSISSSVGGVPEYVTHFENGILYRFEEYELLAEYIGRIFEDDDLARKLSENGKKSMSNVHGSAYEKIIDIYKDIINTKRSKS